MLTLRKPAPSILQPFLDDQAGRGFTYEEVGATAGELPPGYIVDRTRIVLGTGQAAFDTARLALQNWQQFRIGWVDAWPRDTRLEPGQPIAIMGWAVGLWWLNACRIIDTVDESGPVERYGFSYGTLPAHVQSGEERFLLEWDRSSNEVCYEILAFSRPNHVLTRLGYPLVRRSQKRFGRDSAAAMYRCLGAIRPLPTVTQNTRNRLATSGSG